MRPDDDRGWTTLEELDALRRWAGGRKRIVEVGTWKGRSAYALASGMAEDGRLWCIDDFSGDPDIDVKRVYFPEAMTEAGRDEVAAEWAERMAGFGHCAQLIRSPSELAAANFANGTLCMVFVDGCHAFEQVLADLDAWMPKVKPGGLLCGHDWSTEGVMRALLERFPGQFKLGPGKLWMVERPA